MSHIAGLLFSTILIVRLYVTCQQMAETSSGDVKDTIRSRRNPSTLDGQKTFIVPLRLAELLAFQSKCHDCCFPSVEFKIKRQFSCRKRYI
jgi:hypothetical protein